MNLSKPLFISTLASSLFALLSIASADTGLLLNTANNHWYQRFDSSMGWYAAKAFCEKRGGYLATITTQAENEFVWTNLASKSPYNGGTWLGATNDKTSTAATSGAYQWITGEKWVYSNWNTGEPSNYADITGGGEHYLAFFAASVPVQYGTWNDMNVYNQGTAWAQYREVSTLCEWGGNMGSWNF